MFAKSEAIEKLQRQLNLIDEIKSKPRFSPDFEKWRRDTEVAIEYIFGQGTRHIQDFTSISYSASVASLRNRDSAFDKAFWRGLDNAASILKSFVDEVKEYWEGGRITGDLPRSVPINHVLNIEQRVADVLVVCALERELNGFQRATGGTEVWQDCSQDIGDPFRVVQNYCTTEIQSDLGAQVKVVASSAANMGLVASAILTTQAVIIFNPKLVIMVGIAAGVRGDDRGFGDILVADPAFDYSSGKLRSEQNGGFSPDFRPIPANQAVISSIRRLANNSELFQEIRRRFDGDKPRQSPKVFIGPFGSADQVVDDVSRIEEIREHQRKVIGIDMETFAVYKACQEACVKDPPDFVSIKSISDFASEKHDSWQSYAIFTSAHFAAEFIRDFGDSLQV